VKNKELKTLVTVQGSGLVKVDKRKGNFSISSGNKSAKVRQSTLAERMKTGIQTLLYELGQKSTGFPPSRE